MTSLFHSLNLPYPAAIAVASSASAPSIDRVKQLFAGAKYAEAKTELLALQRANDRSAAVAYYLGRIATIDADGDEAIRQFERAVELDPNQVDARLSLVQFYAMAPGVMGGSMDKAREQADEVAKRNAMRGAIARGMIAEQEKNAAAEEAAYQKAIAAAPDSSAGYFALGNTYARDGKAAKAFATLRQYVRRHPDDHWALYYTGRVAGTTGQQLERGEDELKQFLATPPSDAHAPTIAEAYYWLGQIAEKRRAKDAAREHYRTALKINPKSQASKRALDALK